MPLSPPVAALVRQFHAQRPARIWSLIVTLYGDAIVPRGGSLWIGSLIEIMALFRIDAGHVRTAISRLSSDGWLASEKKGRASYYRFSKQGEGEFLSATRRIYRGDGQGNGALRLVLLTGKPRDAALARKLLQEAGFAAASSLALVALADPPAKVARMKGVIVVQLAAEQGAELAHAAWQLDHIGDLYRRFIERFAPLEAATADKKLSDADALVARTLMIHAFRRIVLRDPGLPDALLPRDWPGKAARQLAGAIYARLLAPSEAFLDARAENEKGPLPPLEAAVAKRFH